MQDVLDAVERCKISTLFHQPFFGVGVSKMRWEIDESIATACTDGTFVKFNPDFVRSLTKPKMIGLAVHEVMHVYSKHHLRRGNRDPYLWNVAGDYFINLKIMDAIHAEKDRRGVSCMELPDGALLDGRFRDMSTDDIYNILKQDPPTGPGQEGDDNGESSADGETEVQGDAPGQGEDSQSNEAGQSATESENGQGGGKRGQQPVGTWGDVIDAPVSTTRGMTEAERDVEVMVEQAAQLAKSRGKVPGCAEELLDEYKKPSVDWREVLRQLMQSLTIVDYTYQRSMPKMHHLLEQHGSFIPDFHRENMGELVVAIDTSGSVSTDEVKQFMGEIESICEDVRPSRVHVVQCDARVQHVDTFDMGDPFEDVTIHGRGGTRFQPVFDWVEEEGIEPVALVYLTDGEAPAPDEPQYPVVWGVTTNHQQHLFGEVLSVELNGQ